MYVHSAACCLEYLKSMETEVLSGVKGQVWLVPGSCSMGIQPGPAGLGCSGLAWGCREAAAGLSSGSCRGPLSSGLGEIRMLRPERHLRGSLLGWQVLLLGAVSQGAGAVRPQEPLPVVPVALGSCGGNCQV